MRSSARKPISQIHYCGQNNLSTEERLKLFIQVGHAIQHAHQKGISSTARA